MDGRQSFLLNNIKKLLRNGATITHVLNIKGSQQRTSKIGNQLRTAVFRRIVSTPILKVVNGEEITITWMTTATTSSAYYHSNADVYTDTGILGHTELLLHDLLDALDAGIHKIGIQGI